MCRHRHSVLCVFKSSSLPPPSSIRKQRTRQYKPSKSLVQYLLFFFFLASQLFWLSQRYFHVSRSLCLTSRFVWFGFGLVWHECFLYDNHFSCAQSSESYNVKSNLKTNQSGLMLWYVCNCVVAATIQILCDEYYFVFVCVLYCAPTEWNGMMCGWVFVWMKRM